jgi:polyphosphate kinase
MIDGLPLTRETSPAPAAGEMGAARLAKLLDELSCRSQEETLRRRHYFEQLSRLQAELVKMQEWVQSKRLKIVVLFEGRDAAGKGSVIKRITEHMNPRGCRAIARLPPDTREKGQWFFQRYVQHLPSSGEIVLFDRSWYNRAGVERVMGFCTEEECEDFLVSVPQFERMLIRSGIVLIKYWFSITYEEQYFRLLRRAADPLKQWKLSGMDIAARDRWDQYTQAKNMMFERTHIPEAPWWIVDGVDKRKARLNCIQHLLDQVPYGTIDRGALTLPPPVTKPEHMRAPALRAKSVPAIY